MSREELLVLRKNLSSLLDKGFIRASSSAAAAPVLYVRKPSRGLRFCCDYRALNAITQRDRYLLPLISETLRALSQAKWFSKLDVVAAFHKMRMAEGDDSSPANKCVLSNASLGRVACMIYQSTHNAMYLDQCTEFYDWLWHNLFVPSTGEVYGCIELDGTIDYGHDPYNLGSMADVANMLWLINNGEVFLNDAKMAISYAFSKVTINGIFSNPSNTGGWTDDLTCGVGRTVSNNRLWDTY